MRLLPKLKYPKPTRSAVSDVLHGVTVPDPYRWMENPDSPETKQFVREQNEISIPFLEDCDGHREQIRHNLNTAQNYRRFTAPVKHGDFYYYTKNTGLQNHDVVYRKKTYEKNDDPEEVFLDPNTLSKDGTASLAAIYVSNSGKYFGYAISQAGSDWQTIHVRDTETKTDLSEKIERVRLSAASWTHDEQGFFYAQYPDWKDSKISGTDTKAAINQKIFYHRVGTNQDDDVLIAEFPEHPDWRTRPQVSPDGKYLILSSHKDTLFNQVFVTEIPEKISEKLKLKTIYGKFDCNIDYLGNDGDTFYWRTDKDRPNYGVVKMDINRPDDKWTDVIKEDPKRAMVEVKLRGVNKFVVRFIQDVSSVIEIFDMNGNNLQKLPFGFGKISVAGGKRNSSEVFFSMVSFQNPKIVYRCDIGKAPSAELEELEKTTFDNWSTDDLEFKQEFFTSKKDGTRVPMYIMHRANQTMDGTAPGFLYVYGGFGISIEPGFSIFNLMLIYTFGFIVTIANVRGGGEYGKHWHDAGRLEHKQNTLDDVHSAAMYLAEQNYSSSNRIALHGRSNGGMVTLASINQRPDLFGAAISGVPVADLYRFHKFTIGYAWMGDYGNPDNATQFEFIRKISPLHNIPTNITNYPSLLVVTADHDDRVVPSHSLKFIAEIQHRLGEHNKNPLLASIDTNAGHGAGKPISKRIEDNVNQMCFLSKTLDLKYDGEKFSKNITSA